jgi:hypothetical protein
MTYPVALKDNWVSPKDPAEVYPCALPDACPGGDPGNETQLRVSGQPCSTSDKDELSPICIAAVGAQCNEGYAAVEGAGCSTCCKKGKTHPAGSNCNLDVSYYLTGERQCVKCTGDSKLAVAGLIVFFGLVLGPIALKLADVFKSAGAVQAPIMSLINFMQSASLFRFLDLRWPPGFQRFCKQVASIFMFQLPDLPLVVHPECAFTLTYSLRWALSMLSPFLLMLILGLALIVRLLVAYLAQQLIRRLDERAPTIVSEKIEAGANENASTDLGSSMNSQYDFDSTSPDDSQLETEKKRIKKKKRYAAVMVAYIWRWVLRITAVAIISCWVVAWWVFLRFLLQLGW